VLPRPLAIGESTFIRCVDYLRANAQLSGLTQFAALYRSLSPHGKTFMNTAAGIMLLLLGVSGSTEREPAGAAQSSSLSSAHYSGDASDAGNDEPGAVAPVVYSVAEIPALRTRYQTGTELTVRERFYRPRCASRRIRSRPMLEAISLWDGERRHVRPILRAYCQFSAVLQTKMRVKIRWLECDMSQKSCGLRTTIHLWERVQAHGT